MRARNREINIFNMSLLDILTGMLGAFLFLMLGMLPYYAKVSKMEGIDPAKVKQIQQENADLKDKVNLLQQQIADLQKQIEDLQKMLAKNGGGPLTADQVQQLMDQLNQLKQQVRDLQGQLQDAQQQAQLARQEADQAKKDLNDMTKDRDFWKSQQGIVTIVGKWDSTATDIDLLALNLKNGKFFSPKNEKLFGQDAHVLGDDSHIGSTKVNHEGLSMWMEVTGDYLIMYRVPKGVDPSTYSSLSGYWMYYEVSADHNVHVREDSLGESHAASATVPGIYAWCVIHYDLDKLTCQSMPLPDKLPPGVYLPGHAPAPAGVPSPAASASPGASAPPGPAFTPPHNPMQNNPAHLPGFPSFGGGLGHPHGSAETPAAASPQPAQSAAPSPSPATP